MLRDSGCRIGHDLEHLPHRPVAEAGFRQERRFSDELAPAVHGRADTAQLLFLVQLLAGPKSREQQSLIEHCQKMGLVRSVGRQ